MLRDLIVDLAALLGAGVVIGGYLGGLVGILLRRPRERVGEMAVDYGYVGGVVALGALGFDVSAI